MTNLPISISAGSELASNAPFSKLTQTINLVAAAAAAADLDIRSFQVAEEVFHGKEILTTLSFHKSTCSLIFFLARSFFGHLDILLDFEV